MAAQPKVSRLPSSGMPTSMQVAHRAGVSRTTVSLVLNGAGSRFGLSAATQARVSAVAADLGYTPNSAARNLRRQRTNSITFICPDLGNPYFAEVIAAAQSAAHEHGYLVSIIDAHGEAAMLQAIARLRGSIADGVITMAPTRAVRDGLRELSARGIACVTLQDQAGDPAIPSVCIGLEAGGEAATSHLISCGYRRIAHVSAMPSYPRRTDGRVLGYRRALQQADLPAHPDWLIEAPNSMAGGADAVDRLLARPGPRPEALFMFNDQMAVGALRALHLRGLRVPADMAVVGFDGIALGAFTTPALTTVEHPRHELGRQAAYSLVELLSGTKAVVPAKLLPGRLIVRESCGGRA